MKPGLWWPSRCWVQLWDEVGSDIGILYGSWERLPWGYGDECFAVYLDSCQSLHIWLEGVTDTPASKPEPLRISLERADFRRDRL